MVAFAWHIAPAILQLDDLNFAIYIILYTLCVYKHAFGWYTKIYSHQLRRLTIACTHTHTLQKIGTSDSGDGDGAVRYTEYGGMIHIRHCFSHHTHTHTQPQPTVVELNMQCLWRSPQQQRHINFFVAPHNKTRNNSLDLPNTPIRCSVCPNKMHCICISFVVQ